MLVQSSYQEVTTQQVSNTAKVNSTTLNNFEAIFKPVSATNVDSNFLEEATKKIATLSYEEAKQYKSQIDNYFKQLGFPDDAPLSKMLSMSFPWINTIGLTNDESFNKALFDNVKTKEATDGWLYMSDTIHNMEYAVGIKKYPAGALSIEEAQGDAPFLSRNGAKQIDIANFFDKVLEGYKYWAKIYQGIEEQTNKIITGIKDLKEDYQKNLDENKALLEQLTKNTKPNPLEIYALNNPEKTATDATSKQEKFRVVAFIDKYNGFSSLSATDEKIFRDILADDTYTMNEIQSLSYEQVKKFNNYLAFGLASGISPDEIPVLKSTDFRAGAMLHATQITDNEDFNKALFQTVQTFDDQIEYMNFIARLSDSLGWNDKTHLIPERDNPELRKESTEEDWEIKNYTKFIASNIKELHILLKNPIFTNEDKELYRKLLNNFLVLQKDYEKI
ncbi:MAG: hypothetical protein RBT59_05720 [Arcobacteraceae bacterium]|jgi:hypothetical protein|nr:hypothetical protein [Arcobacteraceae bacterium]